jgi:hypothetical protein
MHPRCGSAESLFCYDNAVGPIYSPFVSRNLSRVQLKEGDLREGVGARLRTSQDADATNGGKRGWDHLPWANDQTHRAHRETRREMPNSYNAHASMTLMHAFITQFWKCGEQNREWILGVNTIIDARRLGSRWHRCRTRQKRWAMWYISPSWLVKSRCGRLQQNVEWAAEVLAGASKR